METATRRMELGVHARTALLEAGAEGVIERVYYVAKTASSYGYGQEFPGTPDGHREACEAARATITRIDYSMLSPPKEEWTRAWVEKRFTIKWLDGAGVDMPVESVELFLNEAAKRAVRASGKTTQNPRGYAATEVQDLLARGPQPDEGFFRMKVTGEGETKWVNVTPDQLARIAEVLE